MDSNLYGAFPVKWSFLIFAGSLFGAGKAVLRPVAWDQVRSACSGLKALRNTSHARRQAAKLCYRFGPLTPSARSANLIPGDGTKNGFPSSEQRTGKNQKRPLDRKSPIQVRIRLPPAKSLRTVRSLLESPRTPAVIVEAPVNGTDAANVRFDAWQFRQILGRGAHGVLLCQAELAAAVRAFVESCRYPHQPAGVDPSLPSPAERLRGATGEPGEGRLGIGTRGRGSGATATPIWGLSPEAYMQHCDPWPLSPNGELLLGPPRRDCDRAGQSGLVLGRYLHSDGQGLPLPGGSCRNLFYRRRNRDLSGTTPSPPDTDPPKCALIS